MDLSAFFSNGKKSGKGKELEKSHKERSLKKEKSTEKKTKSSRKAHNRDDGKAKTTLTNSAEAKIISPSGPTVKIVQIAPSALKKNARNSNDPEDTPLESPLFVSSSETSEASTETTSSSPTSTDLLRSTKTGVAHHASLALKLDETSTESDQLDDEDIEIVVNPSKAVHYVPVHDRASAASGSNSSRKKDSPNLLRNSRSAESSPKQATARKTGDSSYARLENFEQRETLGYGSFGCVHHVRNKVDGREYACKVLAKDKIVQKRQVVHLKNEKNILLSLNNPFIIQMFTSFVDDRNIYLILEYCDGGELFHLLRRAGRLSIRSARFYAAEIVLALEYIHSFHIAFRDMKPENILLTRKGHLKLCDFGFAKIVDDRTWTLCGTPEYLAPEVIMGTGHDSAVDWWALGVLIFEMLAGYPPFYGDQPFDIYEKICDSAYRFPSNFEPLTRDIISRFLSPQKQLRLGVAGGIASVKNHGFFNGIDWSLLAQLELDPPSTPVPMPPRPESYFRDALSDFDEYSLKRPKSEYKSPHDEIFLEFDLSFPN